MGNQQASFSAEQIEQYQGRENSAACNKQLVTHLS